MNDVTIPMAECVTEQGRTDIVAQPFLLRQRDRCWVAGIVAATWADLAAGPGFRLA